MYYIKPSIDFCEVAAGTHILAGSIQSVSGPEGLGVSTSGTSEEGITTAGSKGSIWDDEN